MFSYQLPITAYPNSSPPTIGVFDSGVGGLSVLREIKELLPDAPLLYAADQAHVPYGTRPADEVCWLTERIIRFLLSHNAQLIMVACNTATAAAIDYLRQTFPQVPFVGMEPAIKPAVQQTKTGVLGVLATANTFQSNRYVNLLSRFATDVRLLQNPCIGLVERIERGELATAETEQFLRLIVDPMLKAGVDTLILGCTHYQFVRPLLEKIVGATVQIIDPATAVAQQVQRLFSESHYTKNPLPSFYTSGNTKQLQRQIEQLLGWKSQSVAHIPHNVFKW